MTPRAAVVGTGLVGASVGLALRRQGWHVTGTDRDGARAERAREVGAVDAVGLDPAADLTVVATPVGAVAAEAAAALARGPGVVTDVGGVKAPVVAAVGSPRFVGGHPMAGSEQDGVDGASADLFEGATWVLTPTADTDPDAYAAVHAAVTSLGAEVVALPPERHDEIVAVVSHVPHLTAAALMALAAEGAGEDPALLRLAAGGFRDMTRVASGTPAIWPDVCGENRDAIVAALDRLLATLADVRAVVAAGDRRALLTALERARSARSNLPARWARPAGLVELRVPVPDRPGVLAEVTTLATDLGADIADLEIAHSAEGDRGVLLLLVDGEAGARLRDGLAARGYRASVAPLGRP
ncbi:MAG TPA: prephenate dehydrogenase/arogenate dehydrogenase family protein [Acidimicrobiales bacterium]